jgi:peptidyl-prolyl cis-trans isomerase D
MLKKLRNKKTAKKIWIILAVLVVPAFVLWGLGGAVRSQKNPRYIGKLFNRNVSSLEYKEALEAVKNVAILQFGDDLSTVQKYLNFESQALERILLLDEAKKRKISVGDKEVVDFIRKSPLFQKKERFDPGTYYYILKYYMRTQPRIFEEQTRQNLELSELYNKLTDGLAVKDEEIKTAYERENAEVSIFYIASLLSELEIGITIPDAEARDYFRKNQIEFKQPVSFNLEYVSLSFENEKTAQEKIDNIYLRLKKREGFARVAKDFGLTVKETGIFAQTDPIPGIGWAPQILTLIFKAKTGDYLTPVQIDKNIYVMRIKERKEPFVPEFEAIKDKVKQALTRKRAQESAKEKAGGCLKKLKEEYLVNPKSVDLAKAAKAFGLKADSTASFKYGSYIEGIGSSDIFWLNAKGLKEGDFSEIIEMPTGYYIIKLKSRTPIDEKKLAAEKEAFGKKLLAQKKQEYFARYVEDLKRKLQMQ